MAEIIEFSSLVAMRQNKVIANKFIEKAEYYKNIFDKVSGRRGIIYKTIRLGAYRRNRDNVRKGLSLKLDDDTRRQLQDLDCFNYFIRDCYQYGYVV